jgi:putative transposase
LYSTPGSIGFFTIRAYGTVAPFVSAPLNQALLDALMADRYALGMDLYAFCLMPDHLHLLLGPREACHSMLTFVDRFKGKSTNLSWKHGHNGKLWQPRSFDHLVRRNEELRSVAEYILGNPVRKGLVEHVEDYPWSGLVDPLPW